MSITRPWGSLSDSRFPSNHMSLLLSLSMPSAQTCPGKSHAQRPHIARARCVPPHQRIRVQRGSKSKSTVLACWIVNMFLKVGAKTKLRGGWWGWYQVKQSQFAWIVYFCINRTHQYELDNITIIIWDQKMFFRYSTEIYEIRRSNQCPGVQWMPNRSCC